MAGEVRKAAVALLVSLMAMTSAATATAVNEVESDVESDGQVVSVTLLRSGDTSRVVGVNGGGHGSNYNESDGCYYSAIEVRNVVAIGEQFEDPPSNDAIPYLIYCGGAFDRAIWVTPADIVDYDDVARGEADHYLQTILGPGLDLRHAPDAYAITGAPSHHWITGWNGQPIAVPPINPFGDQLDITLTLESVTWNFGDDSPTVADDLGTPAPSTVQHTYTHRSTETDPNGTYTVAATVTIAVTYSINNGPSIVVTPPLTTNLTAPITVRELQAVLE